MNRNWGRFHYSSVFVEDTKDGFAGFELYCCTAENKKRVASVIFWDASGQFAVETFGTDVPLDIIEELIAEAKDRIKVT